MRRTLVLLPLLALAVAGCESKSKSRAKAKRAKSKHPILKDKPFDVALVVLRDGAPPKRFSAPLPTTMAAFKGDWRKFPPRSMIQASLCAGDPSMRTRFETAVKKGLSAAPKDDKLPGRFAGLLGYCSDPSMCDWLAKMVESGDPHLGRVAWPKLAMCGDPKYAPLFAKKEAPAGSVVQWYFGGSEKKLPYHKRLLQSAREVAASGSNWDVRRIGFAFAYAEGKDAVIDLRTLAKQTTNDERRALMMLGLQRHPDKKIQALGKEACKHPKVAKDSMCGASRRPSSAEKPPPSLDEQVRGWEVDLAKLIGKQPKKKAEILAASTACAEGRGAKDRPSTIARCLESLAKVDRKQAVAAATSLAKSPRKKSGYLNARIKALTLYPKDGGLEARLAKLGLVGPSDDNTKRAFDATTIMMNAERATNFDTETGMFPNEHDALLSDLATLARPELDGIVFEEVVPRSDRGPYMLKAYFKGKIYHTMGKNLGDWYDMKAVLGLLNYVLMTHKSKYRYATLPTGDQTATVIAGPRDGILEAAKEGLIDIGDADAARQSGKAFERKVLEAIKAGKLGK